MTTHLPAALLPLLLALVQGLLLWALWSLRRSFVPQAEHLRCRRDEQRREALWLRASICWNRLWRRNGNS